MKSTPHTKDQQLFDSLRKSPTELSLDHVESIIHNLPGLSGKPPVKNNWTHFFSLNTILVIFVSIAAMVSLLILNQADENKHSTSAIAEPVEEAIPVAENKNSLATSLTKPSLSFSPSIKKEKAAEIPKEKISFQLPDKKKAKEPLVEKTIITLKEAPSTPEKTLDETPQEKKYSGTGIPKTIIKTDPSLPPEMSGLALKKLKKQLYKKLLADEMIGFEGQEVEMQLPGGEVIVNGQVLDSILSQKYYKLTHKVGIGPDRKIKMDENYIKAGDFTAEGFRGSGVGTFMEEEEDSEDSEEEEGLYYESGEKRGEGEDDNINNKEELVRLEQKERDRFAEEILEKSGPKEGRKRLFSVDLNEKETRKLFNELYETLLSDQLIESSKDFVLFELPEDHIRLNGKPLEDELYQKYSKLFSTYKIKQGALCEVRLSEHTISIGEFNGSNFRGTTATYID